MQTPPLNKTISNLKQNKDKVCRFSFCMTFRLVMKHHHIKFGNKFFGSLEYINWTVIGILNLRCDLDLERSTPFFFLFLQDTLAYDNIPLDQVWLLKNQQFIRYSRKSNILII